MKTELKKQAYTAPSIEVIEMENEGVIAASNTNNTVPGFGNGGTLGSSSSRARGYSSASSSDLEDMINDILTVEN